MTIKHQTSEKYSSSTVDRKAILGAVNIVQDRIDGIPVCVLKKIKFVTWQSGKEVFNEGWQVADTEPNFYNLLVSTNKKYLAGDHLPTILSVKGEPKVKYPLPIRYLTYLNIIQEEFSPELYTFSGGQFLIKNKEKAQERVNELLECLANIDNKAMRDVLELHYSKFQINRIEKASAQQVCQWIDELECFAKNEKRIISEDEAMPLLALGLTGFSKTLESRRNMRLEFWRQWNMHRSDIVVFSSQFVSSYSQEKWLYG